jgi:4-hydroxymandelate oxidase
VFIGRTALWGLAVDGADGVLKALTILKNELEVTMSLA